MDSDLAFIRSLPDENDGRMEPSWMLTTAQLEARRRKQEQEHLSRMYHQGEFSNMAGRPVRRDPQFPPPPYDSNGFSAPYGSPRQIPPTSFDYQDGRYPQPPAPDSSSNWRHQVPAAVNQGPGPSSMNNNYCEDDAFHSSSNAWISKSRDRGPQMSHQRGRYFEPRSPPAAFKPRFNNKRKFSTGNAFKNSSKPFVSASKGSEEMKSKLRAFKTFLVKTSLDSDPNRVVNLMDEEELGTLRSLHSKAMATVRSAVEDASNTPPKKKAKRTAVSLDYDKSMALKALLVASVYPESINAEKCVTFMDMEEQLDSLYSKLTALVKSYCTAKSDQDANDGGESDGGFNPARGRNWGERRNGKLNDGKVTLQKDKSPQGKGKTNRAWKRTTKAVEETSKSKRTLYRKGQGNSSNQRFCADDTGFIPLGKKGVSLANWKPGKVGEDETSNYNERETSQTRSCPVSVSTTNDVSDAESESEAESDNHFASIPNTSETEKTGKPEIEHSAHQDVIDLGSSDSEPEMCTSTQRSSRATSENFEPVPYSDSVMGFVLSSDRISEIKQRTVTGSEHNVLAENDMVFNCTMGKIKLESDYRQEVALKEEKEVGTHDQEENGELNLSYQFSMQVSESGTANEGNEDADDIIEIRNDYQTADGDVFIEEIISARENEDQPQENGENDENDMDGENFIEEIPSAREDEEQPQENGEDDEDLDVDVITEGITSARENDEQPQENEEDGNVITTEEVSSVHENEEQPQENGENEMNLQIVKTVTLHQMDLTDAGAPCSADLQ